MGPPWIQSDWLDHASEWIHNELRQSGLKVTGPIERCHVRPWSIVLRVPTLKGDLFFKASAAMLGHEATITQALSHWQSNCLPMILSTDLRRGWMLMSDGGVTLRQVIKADRDLRHWKRLLPQYAELQIELAEHIPDLLSLGLPDRCLAILPDLYRQLLENIESLNLDQPGGLTSEEHKHLIELTAEFSTLCEQIAAYPVPESIHHGDFHDGNIFIEDGRFVFFDWGDSSATHPYCSLRTAFVSIENTLSYEENSPVFKVLRDAYLEPWTKYDTRKHLTATFDLVERVSPIVSALGWHRVISALEEPARNDYAEAVPSLFKEFLGYMNRATI